MEAVEDVLVGAKVVAVVEGKAATVEAFAKIQNYLCTIHINISNNLHVVKVTCTRLHIQYRSINSITYAIIINHNFIMIM